jgi:glucose/arabinose dehydrogenase
MPRVRRSSGAILPAIILITGLAGPTSAAPTERSEPAPSATTALATGQVRLAPVTGGLSSPIGVVNAGDGTGRLFVLEQRGTVRVVSGGRLVGGFFLDVRNVTGGFTTGGERGLLGLAFHPSFETNRKLFVYYTDGGGDITIAEMTANGAGTAVSAGTKNELLTIEHSAFSNHNGGQLLFGPDGYLYAFVGDGGSSGDPSENAQNLSSKLGKTLRIAPNLHGEYTIPAGNPYAGGSDVNDEIWSFGLRNPWRASFDRSNGTLWIADVGQGSWEEINREPPGTGGRNYGWDCREGKHNFEGGCTGYTDPVAEYGHTGGSCSVTGGFVYRGSVFLDLRGHYILGDYCSGRIWTMVASSAAPVLRLHRDTSANISSFGESEAGDIYMTDHGGTLYRVVAPPFSDVTTSRFINDITWLYYEGLTTGCGGGRYCPTGIVTRGQMATFLDRALNLPSTSRDFFTDDEGNTHEDSINRLAASGITFGCSAGRFCPDGRVTRAQMASFLSRGFHLPATGRDFFTDDEGNRHETNINRLAASGITVGCAPNRYCPSGLVNREQMAAFLHRAL